MKRLALIDTTKLYPHPRGIAQLVAKNPVSWAEREDKFSSVFYLDDVWGVGHRILVFEHWLTFLDAEDYINL